jgi:hypothetical protein
VADETTAGPASAGRCPRCHSPRPKLHPATQADGGEVQMCPHSFHYPPTPELDRQSQAIEDGRRLVEFLDWLSEQGYHLAKYHDGQPYDANPGPQKLIAGFYGIDLDKIEAERRALLEHVRELNR